MHFSDHVVKQGKPQPPAISRAAVRNVPSIDHFICSSCSAPSSAMAAGSSGLFYFWTVELPETILGVEEPQGVEPRGVPRSCIENIQVDVGPRPLS